MAAPTSRAVGTAKKAPTTNPATRAVGMDRAIHTAPTSRAADTVSRAAGTDRVARTVPTNRAADTDRVALKYLVASPVERTGTARHRPLLNTLPAAVAMRISTARRATLAALDTDLSRPRNLATINRPEAAMRAKAAAASLTTVRLAGTTLMTTTATMTTTTRRSSVSVRRKSKRS